MGEQDRVARTVVSMLVGITVGLVVARLFVAVGQYEEGVGLGWLSGAVATLWSVLVTRR